MFKKSSVGDVEIARRMRAAGIPGEFDAVDQALVIHQEGGPAANVLSSCYLVSYCRSSTIEIYIKVIGNQGTPFLVCGFELRLSWKDTPTILLPGLIDAHVHLFLHPGAEDLQTVQESVPQRTIMATLGAPQIYKFPGYSASRFDKRQVIFQSGKTLRRGQFVEGYLLATDLDPVPPEIRHGARVTATLTITDQFDAGHSSDLVLWVDRMAECGPKPKAIKPRRRLFDQPDKVGGRLPCNTEAAVEADVEIIEGAVVGNRPLRQR